MNANSEIQEDKKWNRNIKIFKIVFVLFNIILFTALGVNTVIVKKEVLSLQFAGIVDSVHYSAKGFPNVTVKGIDYYLFGYNCKHKIEKGDSIIKQTGKREIKLIRNRTGELIIFN